MTRLGTFVGPGSIDRYSKIISNETFYGVYL